MVRRTGSPQEKGEGDEALLRLVQDHAAELLRFARRFSLCADDAHDAYQRSIEILIRRMRRQPPDEPLKWLRTVVRNEALSIRMQQERLLGREEADFERHEGGCEDPSEHVVAHERIDRLAEALQRLKPQEVTALVLRSEGLSYREIGARQQWTYTKVNRCLTEGRRALRDRLGAIESGAECDRWLPQLSALADGEATPRQLRELRPHLRACPACRATLRDLHRVPSEVAALVPVALVPFAGDPGAALARHVETAVHAVLERATLAAMRLQGAVDALPGTKLAAVAASTAAIAGGGAAIEHHAHAAARRPAVEAAAPAVPAASAVSLSASAARPLAVSPPRDGASSGGGEAESEFALEPAASPSSGAPTGRPTARAASTGADAPSPAPPAPTAPAPREEPVAEFAGP